MFKSKTPTRSEALSLFGKAAAMMEQVVNHHKARVSELEVEIKEHKDELVASQKSMDALNKIINPK